MLIVYAYTPDGVYAGEVVARRSPLEPDTYLVPAGCTAVQPPAHEPGFRARYDEQTGKWSIEPMPKGPTEEELAEAEALRVAHEKEMELARAQTRQRQWLQLTDGPVARHRDQLELGAQTTLTPEQYTQLQQFRQQVRELNNVPEWPSVVWPSLNVPGLELDGGQ